ncbi:hypothetical protein K1T71_004265 [Dendrolimus kikuchii]|uniref:Uncharacterized protein n=1 Tax=Dendrolimus kikuchii TaxID=765133 RepID=A0ACC1D6T7_9NEOP|nr:hypothetical protein K1T71_004265 [Dendrolimus kikuchii]
MTHWRLQTSLFLTFITFTSTAVVKWLPNSSFNLAINYKDGKLPCSKQTVVFPETIIGSINLESAIQVSGFVLPKDGELVIDGEINFGALDSDTNCTFGSAFYTDKSTSVWNQADVWSSDKFNEATPDASKVPCYDDTVVFPADAKFTIRLPDSTQTVARLTVGQQSYTTLEFVNRVRIQSDESQQFTLNNYFQTGVEIKQKICNKVSGCPCQETPIKIDCSAKFCPIPPCVAPIKPDGFCCHICGGYLAFDVDESFDMVTFKDLIEKTIDTYGNTIVYHLGFVLTRKSSTVQLVVVDKGTYTGISAEAVNYVESAIGDNWVRREKLVGISGSPLYKRWMGLKIFVSMFFVVVAVMGAVYVYYYRMPNIRIPVLERAGAFSRINRRTDSVVSLTRRDSTASGTVRTAFRNPMYDSIRGRVLVEETAVEE